MTRILKEIEELLYDYHNEYCQSHPASIEQNIKQYELQEKQHLLEDLLEDLSEEIALRERNNCEEERAELIAEYEADIEILNQEISRLKGTMREFLGRLNEDILPILEKEAYNSIYGIN